jgi:hypothetical protein
MHNLSPRPGERRWYRSRLCVRAMVTLVVVLGCSLGSVVHRARVQRDAATDAGLAHLKGLTRLTNLNLAGTGVTDAGVQDLQEALPKVRIIR